MKLNDFGKYRNFSFFFFRSTNANSYTLWSIESNSLEWSSVQMEHSRSLKLVTVCIDCIDYCIIVSILENFKNNNIFTGVQEWILIPYSLWRQIMRSMLVCKRYFGEHTNLIWLLYITVPLTILILVRAGGIVFLQDVQNIMHCVLGAQNIWVRFSILKFLGSVKS